MTALQTALDNYRQLAARCAALWEEHAETGDTLTMREADNLADELGDIARGIIDQLLDGDLTDTQAVDWMARMLRAPEWNSAPDYLQEIAETVSRTGRDHEKHPPDCDGCGAWPADGCSAPDVYDHSMAKEDRRNAGLQ
jgi:predicted Zn-ribbon and HTH transcriptional regulator